MTTANANPKAPKLTKTSKAKKGKTEPKSLPPLDLTGLPKPADLDLPAGTLKPTDARIPKNARGFYFAATSSIVLNENILVRDKVKGQNEDFETLCESVKRWGILEPLVCRRTKDGKLELIMGRQRLAAAKRAGLKAVPYVLTAGSDSDMVMQSIDENVARIAMNPVDEARAVARAKMLTGADTNVKLAKIMSKTPRWIAMHMELLDLPEDLLTMLERKGKDGSVTIGKVHHIMRLQPQYRAEYIRRMGALTEKGLRELIERREAKGKVQFIGGKAKPRDTKKGKVGTPPQFQKTTYSKTYKSGKGGKEITVDVLTAVKIEALIKNEEKALNSEVQKKNPNPETVQYHKGRISAFLETMMLDPKAESLEAAINAFEAK